MEKITLDQHISRQFNTDLEHLKTQTLAMGGLVEQQLQDAMRALETGDSELALTVLETEKQIDAMERDIDEACTTVIARRQPAATDLRMILAVSRSVRDLERVGDEAQRIAKMAIGLSEEGGSPRGTSRRATSPTGCATCCAAVSMPSPASMPKRRARPWPGTSRSISTTARRCAS